MGTEVLTLNHRVEPNALGAQPGSVPELGTANIRSTGWGDTARAMKRAGPLGHDTSLHVPGDDCTRRNDRVVSNAHAGQDRRFAPIHTFRPMTTGSVVNPGP